MTSFIPAISYRRASSPGRVAVWRRPTTGNTFNIRPIPPPSHQKSKMASATQECRPGCHMLSYVKESSEQKLNFERKVQNKS